MHINAPNYVFQMHVAYICIYPILLYVKTIYFQNDTFTLYHYTILYHQFNFGVLTYAFYNDSYSIFLCTHMYVRTNFHYQTMYRLIQVPPCSYKL